MESFETLSGVSSNSWSLAGITLPTKLPLSMDLFTVVAPNLGYLVFCNVLFDVVFMDIRVAPNSRILIEYFAPSSFHFHPTQEYC